MLIMCHGCHFDPVWWHILTLYWYCAALGPPCASAEPPNIPSGTSSRPDTTTAPTSLRSAVRNSLFIRQPPESPFSVLLPAYYDHAFRVAGRLNLTLRARCKRNR